MYRLDQSCVKFAVLLDLQFCCMRDLNKLFLYPFQVRAFST
uniref:Uncharacterized protein n=1 Tax=Arundo donax TaxID=35708 RepID=A0A0A9AB93_ARUDO